MAKKKILVVDDEPDVLKYLEIVLLDHGFDVITAINGNECFIKSCFDKPDLITLDISMPSESGIRVLRDLRANERTKDIPVIVITGVPEQVQKNLRFNKKQYGLVDYYEKPIDREKLVRRIKEILSVD